MAGYQKRV